MYLTLDSALDQSTLVNWMSGQSVLDDCLERISVVSGENTPILQHQEGGGFGFFVDIDALISEVAGVSGKSKPGVTVKHLSKIWRIDEKAAKQTIESTSQLLKQEATDKMPRNFGTNDRMLRYKWIKTHFFTNTFFVPEKYRSWKGNKCCQLFVSDIGFVFLVPMQSKGQFPDALKKFCKEIGVPKSLICDLSGE